MNNIVKPKNFDIKLVQLSDPKVNNYGGKTVYINYKEDKIIIDKFPLNLKFHLLLCYKSALHLKITMQFQLQ